MASHNHTEHLPPSLEDNLRGLVRRARTNVSDQLHQCEESVREKPGNSLLVAGLAGYFLHLLPIGAILGSFVRLGAALIRPAVVLYVAAKAFDVVRASAEPSKSSAPETVEEFGQS